MKRLYIISFALVLVIFITLSIVKQRTSTETDKTENDRQQSVEKENIHSFWKIYRRANEQRIAGNLDSAVQGYKAALGYKDKHEDALYYLGNVYMDLGQLAKAEQYWKKLAEVNPRSARSFFQLGHLYLNNTDQNYFDINKAEEYFNRVLNINNEESQSIFYIGQIELIRGNYTKAQHIFKTISGLNFNNLAATFFNSYIDWKQGKLQLAVSRMSATLKSDKSPPPLTNAPAEGETRLGKPLYNSISERKTLFYNYVYDLRELEMPLRGSVLQKRFKKLDLFLQQLRSWN
jgi:tetratricopeptide (TPR) repeat protein